MCESSPTRRECGPTVAALSTSATRRSPIEKLRIKLKYGTPWIVNLRCRISIAKHTRMACDGCGRRGVHKTVSVGGGGRPNWRRYCDWTCAKRGGGTLT